jgi:hypothetical protein
VKRLLLLLLLGCTRAPAAEPPPQPRYYLVGPAGGRSFEAPGGGNTRKLLPGFGMSVVAERMSGGKRWGRTAQGRWIAMAEVAPARAAALAGAVLTGPIDFAWVVNAGAPVFEAPGGRRVSSRMIFARVRLGSCEAQLCRIDGGWMRAGDLRAPRATARPAEAGPTDRWIDVDLRSQTLVAYEGDRPIFATLVSTGIGLPGSALATPTGVFRIRSKHRSANMDNLEHTEVVPYSYEDIPLVQYFTDRVALHAALWHQRFGHPASHGCINLSPADAARLFAFTQPQLPAPDSEIYARGDVGTIVRVR